MPTNKLVPLPSYEEALGLDELLKEKLRLEQTRIVDRAKIEEEDRKFAERLQMEEEAMHNTANLEGFRLALHQRH